MENALKCPYCGQDKNKDPMHFCGCHICGYKSAMIKAADGADILVVDRRMPYLERRCQEIETNNPNLSVVIDRRIVQDDIAGQDRRRPLPLEAASPD
jgi:hypothetical protein